MKIVKSYLKKNFRLYALLSSFAAIFYFISYLYDINVEVFCYSLVCCLLVGLIASILDYASYKKSYQNLEFLKNTLLNDLESLPGTQDSLILYYRETIEKLFIELEATKNSNNQKQTAIIDYYSMWVHQIKTPISTLQFMLENDMLEKTKLEQELFKIERYVEMVLTYVRLGSESTDYVFGKIDISEIVNDLLKKYATLFITKKITLDYVSQETFIVSDKKWLSFAVEQILSNAIKYTKSGGTIKIVLKDNSIEIIDNGIGIKEEDLPRIFEQGFTGFNGRYEKKSSGIGLYLCKKILDNLGHEIKITSKINNGTKVEINCLQNNELRE